MRINNNIPAMTAAKNFAANVQTVEKSVMRLSTGKKLLTDDPAGAAIAQRIRAQVRSLGVMSRNAERMIDEQNIREGDLMARQELLAAMRELSIRLSNDTLTQEEKSILMVEYTELAKEFADATHNRTGMEIIAFDSGPLKGELMFKKGDMVYNGGKWVRLDELIASRQEAGADGSDRLYAGLTDYIDSKIKDNLLSLASVGAFSNRLTHQLEVLNAMEEQALAALSMIEDIDIVKELVDFVKATILVNCSIAVAAYANAIPERVLALLEVE